MYEQSSRRTVRASPAEVYAVLVDPRAVETWRVPDDMTASVEEWEPQEGGRFRVSLTYRADDGPGQPGKSGGGTDTYAGHFARLVPGEQVVEVIEFESPDPALAGEMTMTTTLREVEGGTEVEIAHAGIPDAVRPEDNRAGSEMALANLAAYVERGASGG